MHRKDAHAGRTETRPTTETDQEAAPRRTRAFADHANASEAALSPLEDLRRTLPDG